MNIKRTFDILPNYLENFPDKEDALAAKEQGIWVKYSSKQYVETANYVSYGLLALGLKKGDRIATVSNNRPEWNFMDMGMSQAGIIHIPIYPTISADEYAYILNHAKPKIVIVSDKLLFQKIQPLAEKISAIQKLYTYNEIEGAVNWQEIVDIGKKNEEKYKNELEKIRSGILPEELVTLIYTSGTTGNPKGVMLSHSNIVSNFLSARNIHPFNDSHRTLSFLPLCHILERMVNYHFQSVGVSIYYAENMGTIADNLKEVKPQVFISVPRLIERVYDKIIQVGKDLKGIKKSIFFWAVNLGLKFDYMKKRGWWYNFRLKIARKLVFEKWKAALGGQTGLIIVGGAALQPRLSRVFGAAGIPVLEGYGLTETSPVIAVNNLVSREIMVGTVGPVFEGVEVKIADDGEILCKGPNVMLGYYNEPELTKETIDEDGWLHTGDIGEMVDGKYLKITDRKKEIFKLSSGKYIAPQVIENMLKESLFIEQVMVIGENEKFASAIISPNFQFLHNWCALHDVKFRDNFELICDQKVISRYQKEVNTINKQLGLTEQIKRFRLVQEEWTPQTGELSPTLKLRRNFVYEKYDELLKGIYNVR
ncbi:MAG: long-chain fatty acid--CoA ligase [Bacteroidales bacterium]|nr:long-chain fatty acid--CoA ligase [Bacteroidales bacterium]